MAHPGKATGSPQIVGVRISDWNGGGPGVPLPNENVKRQLSQTSQVTRSGGRSRRGTSAIDIVSNARAGFFNIHAVVNARGASVGRELMHRSSANLERATFGVEI